MNAKERKKIGLPLMVCAVLDLHVRRFTDKELHRFFRRLGEGGVDHERFIPIWGEGLLPFRKQPSGKYNLELFNPEYFNELRRVCKIAYQWQVGIYFDLFDQCSLRGYYEGKQGKNPWTWNENGVKGIYDTSDKAIEIYKTWIKKVIDTVGLYGYRATRLGIKLKNKPNLFGLGNELHFKGTRERLHNWANYWGHGLAGYMRKLGYKQQLLYSGETKTAHALRVYIGPWDGDPRKKPKWDMEFGFEETVDVWHGFYDWRPIVKKINDQLTKNRWFAVSDDGTNVKDIQAYVYPDSINPPDNFACAKTGHVIDACQHIKAKVDNSPARWHHIEMLPRSVSEQSQSIKQLHQDRDVNIYNRIAKRVWGVDITRKYPKWMRRKFK